MTLRPAVVTAVTFVAVVVGALAGACAPEGLKPYLTRFDRPLHICHQGGEDLFPSNTLHAYERCVEDFNTDVLEIDVHGTRDGDLVVLHDETVDRTTDGTGFVKEMSLAEVRQLDAAYWFTPENGRGWPLRAQGITIPTLDEIFEAFPDMLTNVEIKQVEPPIEQALVDTIVAHDMVDKVCVGSFDDSVAQRLRDLLPEACHYAPEDMARGYYIGTRMHTTGLAPPPIDAFALPPFSGGTDVLDARLLEATRLEGKHVWAWTIDDEDEMERLLALGIDGIMTNRPDRLSKVMRELGLRD